MSTSREFRIRQVNTEMNFELSHAVDDSDVAFVMRLDRSSTVCSMMSSRSTHYHKVGTNIDAFINLPTLNYLLAGVQLCYSRTQPSPSKWFELLHDLDQYKYAEPGFQLTLWDLRYIVRELIVPFGIVRGSEKQGGQDETGLSPATWPVNFVANMVLDGHERNVVNYWHYHDVSAGDDLVFRLKAMPIPKGKNAYTLNHYYKRFVQQNFEAYFQSTLGRTYATHVWQLVPDVFSLDCKPENDVTNDRNSGVRMTPGFEIPKDYVWQEQGYWHIARSQVMQRKYALREYYNDDMANQLKVNHLDVTFEPAYSKVPGEERDPASARAVKRDSRPYPGPDDRSCVTSRDASRVRPGMMAPPPPRSWAPELSLEGASSGRWGDLEQAVQPPRVVRRELDYLLDPGEQAGFGLAEQAGYDLAEQAEAGYGLAEPAASGSGMDLSADDLQHSFLFSDPPAMPAIDLGQGIGQGLGASEADGDFSLVFSVDADMPPAASSGAPAGKQRKRKTHDPN